MSDIGKNIINFGLRCYSCGDTKTIEKFSKDKRRSYIVRGGRYTVCRDCVNKKRNETKRVFNIFPDSADEMKSLKSCRICKKEKPLFSFRKNSTAEMGRSSDCKDCYNQYRYGTQDRKLKARDYGRKFRHSINADKFKAMFDSQHGKCGVCKNDLEFLAKNTCVDHDHKTGNIREILCGKCNLGLGHFKDDLEVMKLAIAYLEKHQSLGV